MHAGPRRRAVQPPHVTGTVGSASGTASLRAGSIGAACVSSDWPEPDRIWTSHFAGPLSEPTQIPELPAWLFVADGSTLRTLTACGGVPMQEIALDGQLVRKPVVVELGDPGSGEFAAFVTTSAGSVERIDIRASDGALTARWTRNLRRSVFGTLICPADTFAAPPAVQLRADSSPVFRTLYSTTDVVYVGTDDGCGDTTRNRVYALSAANGSELWAFNEDGIQRVSAIAATPTVDAAGDRLYIGTDTPPESLSDSFFSFDTSTGDSHGTVAWSVNVGSVLAAPVVASGRVSIVSKPGTLSVYPVEGSPTGGNAPIVQLSLGSAGGFVRLDPTLDGSSLWVVDSTGEMVEVSLDPGGPQGIHVVARSSIYGFFAAATTPVVLYRPTANSRPDLYVGGSDGGAWQLAFAPFSETPSANARRNVSSGEVRVFSASVVIDVNRDGTTTPHMVFASEGADLSKFDVPWLDSTGLY